MREQKNLIRRMKLKALILAVTALTMSFPAAAQQGNITLPARKLSADEVFENIHKQTGYKVAANSKQTSGLSVNITRSSNPIRTVLDRMLEGSGLSYRMNGEYIIIMGSVSQDGSTVAVITPRNMAGTVTDKDGNPQADVIVELIDADSKRAATFANGRFMIEGIAPGNHIVKLTSADGENVRYREVNVPADKDADVTLKFSDELLSATPSAVQAAATPTTKKTTAYFVPSSREDNTIRAFTDDPKTSYSLTPETSIGGKQYLPKAAIKTNLLIWGTATPNLAVEFGLAPKWTLDIATGYNPFQLQKGGINKVGFIQPEARYWFCQRFEKHFVGLHAIGFGFNIGDVTFLTRTFEQHRYKGWGAGAGVSYGYHLPMGKRWGWEFTVGVGYVYLEYDKFRCYECDEFVAKKNRHYFGPTKAGISLLFMIK